ncbi:MAG: exo-alpha-sialidase [Lachnospiraceae bacterium]|nr:exo-alpha-sialidase [Lachnospiraceae bacterium]MBP3594378.1 exo-alpha-sialidase [Lachnospiraceae bacterium]
MNFTTTWSYHPYAELSNLERAERPYICRLSHDENSFTVDYIDNGASETEHMLFWRVRDTEEYKKVPTSGGTITIEDIPSDTDYELFIARTQDPSICSNIRLVRTGFVPGKVINYLHPEDTTYDFAGTYLDSPSLAKLPSGRLVSAMGVHKSAEYGENLEILYYSDDNGETWHYLCELFPCRWGKLFVDNGKLYCLGVSCTYGDLLIGCSDDEGYTWGMPTVLLRGSCSGRGGVHHTPMPVLHYKGRLITDVQYGGWHKNVFYDAVLSAKEGSDLLDANNWAITKWWDCREHKEIQNIVNGGITGDADAFKFTIGGIEGSPVVAPNGDVWILHRYGRGKPLILEYDPEDPWGELKNGRIIDVPIKDSKFPVKFDSVSGRYYMLCNYMPEGVRVGRNVCALMYSTDLKEWILDHIVYDFRDYDYQKYAMQYFDFEIDGDDIMFLSRTAFCNADSSHNSNHQTFHRIHNFRK